MNYRLKQVPEDFIVKEIPKLSFSEKGNYTYFSIAKNRCNTEEVIQDLVTRFSLPRKLFSYAGTKDRNASTMQYASVRSRIRPIVTERYEIKIVGCGDAPISLGDLEGNGFEITIRCLDSLPEFPSFFINYFDDQRFGTNNHLIGECIVKGDFRKACELSHSDEVSYHLAQHQNDFVGGMKKLPFKILTLYVHAFQSYLWNLVACRLVSQENSYRVPYILGDLVMPAMQPDPCKIPFIAFDTEAEGDIERHYSDILSGLKLSQRDFVIRKFPELTCQGGERDLVTFPKDLVTGALEEDDLNPGKKKVKVSFGLDKGAYATMFIKSGIYSSSGDR
ncbi:MAG: tRNA pseudouridine(13) synthase TruD [Nanoarchaeota archaeon]|nr:tRNA pseudouridine(13) synthase TruD [Nanoarchaeota archaeon]